MAEEVDKVDVRGIRKPVGTVLFGGLRLVNVYKKIIYTIV